MPTPVTKNCTYTAEGIEYPNRSTFNREGGTKKDVDVAAALAGTLEALEPGTTPEPTTTGEESSVPRQLTMGEGHGIEEGDRLDLYWGTSSKRRGLTVDSVDGNDVVVSGGAGDALPDSETTIAAMVPREETFPVTGNDCLLILARSNARGQIVLVEAGDVEALAISTGSLTEDGRSYVWDPDSGATNPLAGKTVVKAYFSHASTDAAINMVLAVYFDQ